MFLISVIINNLMIFWKIHNYYTIFRLERIESQYIVWIRIKFWNNRDYSSCNLWLIDSQWPILFPLFSSYRKFGLNSKAVWHVDRVTFVNQFLYLLPMWRFQEVICILCSIYFIYQWFNNIEENFRKLFFASTKFKKIIFTYIYGHWFLRFAVLVLDQY